jgi:hypothetical protein
VTQEHVIQAFFNLTNSLYFWFNFKDKEIFLVGLEYVDPILKKLGLKGFGAT